MATRTEALADVEPAAIYTSMRDGILSLAPAEAGIVPSPQCPQVWGVLAEQGFDDGCVTLVSLADGTTSLYFSGGGGIIGVGGHAEVAAATRVLVAAAGTAQDMAPAAAFPLPAAGRARFYLLTFSGVLTAEAGQEELEAGRHPLAPLYRLSGDVVSQVRRHTA